MICITSLHVVFLVFCNAAFESSLLGRHYRVESRVSLFKSFVKTLFSADECPDDVIQIILYYC